MKNIGKLKKIVDSVTDMGYEKENIHIVWVVNDIDMAIKQNLERPRHVREDILMSTHQLVSETMAEIFKGNTNVNEYISGDFWIVFNKRFTDSVLQFGKKVALTAFEKKQKETAGSYIDSPQIQKKLAKIRGTKYVPDKKLDIFYFKFKAKNKSAKTINDIANEYINKIKSYVPNPDKWDI
jgi:hypothetical protein